MRRLLRKWFPNRMDTEDADGVHAANPMNNVEQLRLQLEIERERTKQEALRLEAEKLRLMTTGTTVPFATSERGVVVAEEVKDLSNRFPAPSDHEGNSNPATRAEPPKAAKEQRETAEAKRSATKVTTTGSSVAQRPARGRTNSAAASPACVRVLQVETLFPYSSLGLRVAKKPHDVEFFFIVCRINGMVADVVEGMNRIVTVSYNGRLSQRFRLDESGRIISCSTQRPIRLSIKESKGHRTLVGQGFLLSDEILTSESDERWEYHQETISLIDDGKHELLCWTIPNTDRQYTASQAVSSYARVVQTGRYSVWDGVYQQNPQPVHPILWQHYGGTNQQWLFLTPKHPEFTRY